MRYFIPCVFALGLLGAPASAAVFERDWKSPGDGLLTYDDVNQREWLDVPQTLLAHFPGPSLEDRYQSIVAETSSGGIFGGFTVASSEDVFAMAESAGIDTGTQSLAVNETATRDLIELLGSTSATSSVFSAFSWGMINEIDANNDLRVTANFVVSSSRAGLNLFSRVSLDPPGPAAFTGVMLYRQVPEPTSCLVAVVGAMFLFCKHFLRMTTTS